MYILLMVIAVLFYDLVCVNNWRSYQIEKAPCEICDGILRNVRTDDSLPTDVLVPLTPHQRVRTHGCLGVKRSDVQAAVWWTAKFVDVARR